MLTAIDQLDFLAYVCPTAPEIDVRSWGKLLEGEVKMIYPPLKSSRNFATDPCERFGAPMLATPPLPLTESLVGIVYADPQRSAT
jgi:hypothetical protein